MGFNKELLKFYYLVFHIDFTMESKRNMNKSKHLKSGSRSPGGRKAQSVPKKKARKPNTKMVTRSFTNIINSPWRRITFTIEAEGKIGSWLRVQNDQIAKALYTHLGFKATSDNYLEIKHHTVTVRRMEPGTAIALRVYRIESHTQGDLGSPSVTRSVESYSSSSVTYPVATLTFDKISQGTPLQAGEFQPVYAFYQHEGKNNEVLMKLTLSYRHAETPFEQEVFHKLSLLSIEDDE